MNIDVAASGKAWGFNDSKLKYDKQSKDEEKFMSLVESVEDYSIGSFPPQNGKVEDWINKV